MVTIVFTVNDRPNYLRETLRSWSQVRGVEDCTLIFMMEPSAEFNENLEVIYDWQHPARIFNRNRTRLGVLENPFQGLSLAFDGGADFAILAEDDIVVSRDILEYFAAAREHVTDQTAVICANSRNPIIAGSENDIVRSVSFDPLIWGCTAEQWPFVRDNWDHDYSTGVGGQQAGWDWNLNVRLIPSNGFHALFPVQSRSNHIGLHGTHMVASDFPASQSASFVEDRPQAPFTLA